MSVGAATGFYSGDPLKLFEDMQVLKPTVMATVPRILSRIYAKVYEGVTTKGGVTEWLFNKAVNAKVENYDRNGDLHHALYDKIIFAKVRNLFGGNIKKMVSGSAALDPKILKFFRIALSIPVFEGYG